MNAFALTLPRRRKRTAMPGLTLSLGVTITWLSIIVLIPLSAVFVRAADNGWQEFWEAAGSARALDAYRLSFGGALLAALINLVFGMLVAWVLVRYRFPGKRLFGAMIDLPFALPTAVAGIALTAIYAENGVMGALFAEAGLPVAYRAAGVIVAMVFVGLPFVVRTVEPVLAQLPKEVEEAAITLGATRFQTFNRVLLPGIAPALGTGFALAFARAAGEYGSIIFIAGNMPYRTEIAPLLIVTRLEEYDYPGATAIATVMLCISFAVLLLLNGLEAWQRRKGL